MEKSKDMTRIPFPAVLSMFLCHQPVDLPFDFSVMGEFVILHGISPGPLRQTNLMSV